jgi:hypothetical protein
MHLERSVMQSDARKSLRVFFLDPTELKLNVRKCQWAACRFLFIGGMIFGIGSLVGLYLLAPLYSYWFFGTFRFWRNLRMWPKLSAYGYYFAYLYLKGEVILSFPYTDPPMSKPNLSAVHLNPDWKEGKSCGSCSRCCRKIKCPLVDEHSRCLSFNSFYWRYFNCGRFPSTQREIDQYQCPKWLLN